MNPASRPDLSDRPYGDRVERFLAATPEVLYRAWTIGLDTWFAAPGTLEVRPEVGAPFFFETHHEGERHPHYGRFLELVPHLRIVMTWMTGAAGTEGAETVLSVNLTPSRQGTQLVLTHEGFPNEGAMQRHFPAWTDALTNLDEVTGTG